MPYKKLEFTNAAGQKLSARLDFPPDDKPSAYALFAHCFTCSKNIKAAAHISRALTVAGIAVFRFDFTGLGESEGDFGDTNFSSNVEDLVTAAEFMTQNYEGPKILIGHSLGGAAVLQAAAKIPSSLAVITIAAPADPNHVSLALGDATEIIERRGEAKVDLAGRTFKIKKQFLDDLEEQNQQGKIAQLKKALLVFHSPVDLTVSINEAETIYRTAKHPKSFVSLDDVSVEVHHDRQHVKDCEGCDAEPRKLEVLQKYVTLKGDLSEQERQRLLEIADRCPVHQTLHGDLAIRTELID